MFTIVNRVKVPAFPPIFNDTVHKLKLCKQLFEKKSHDQIHSETTFTKPLWFSPSGGLTVPRHIKLTKNIVWIRIVWIWIRSKTWWYNPSKLTKLVSANFRSSNRHGNASRLHRVGGSLPRHLNLLNNHKYRKCVL